MDYVSLILAGLIYPGLLTGLGFGVLYHRLVYGRLPLVAPAALASREGAAALLGVILAGVSMVALPWPYHPLEDLRGWLWAWAGFELAFLLPLLPALSGGGPKLVRSAIRELQLGVMARMLIWAALAISLSAEWQFAQVPAHILALAAALLCFPAAVGYGPFADEVTVTPQGTALGLPESVAALDRLGRSLRAGMLLAVLMVAALPTTVGPAWTSLLMIGSGWLVVVLIIKRLNGRLPRLPLPATLRLGMIVGVPLVAAATIALALGG